MTISMEWTLSEIEATLKSVREHERIPSPERKSAVKAIVIPDSQIWIDALLTDLGWIGLAYSTRGIRYLVLPRESRDRVMQSLRQVFPDALDAPVPTEISELLREYAKGMSRNLDLSVDWGSMRPFQMAVLDVIRQIPAGETRTYGWVAHAIGRPGAARAVGRALHTNPVPLVLPCHRVVASDGSLGGYGGGLPLKRKLLELEGALLV